jgi:RNA-directed DNA polymerase
MEGGIVMPKDALLDGGARDGEPVTMTATARVSGMQTKIHRWAAADPGRRFDDLFNLVCHPATLQVAWDRVATNKGARTAGSDGLTPARIAAQYGTSEYLDDLRAVLKNGSFRPQPVRERKIPKPGGSGKVRRLGIPTVTDRVVQAALKLVLEPIWETDFKPVSYGFRPRRRAQDAIAEIHHFGTQGYRRVLDADIEACFDTIGHGALMERVRDRVKDKRVLSLVKGFLKAGLLTELGEQVDTPTGTPQGGILSPLLANIALSVLDEHLTRAWEPGGESSNTNWRHRRRAKGLANFRLVRYADDFVILTDGTAEDLAVKREEISRVLAPMGLRLSEAKTQIVHMRNGFDFLGFHIRWKKKRGSSKWYVYTLIARRPLAVVKAKIRALTRRTSQQDLRTVLERLNQILRGWTSYFQHAAAKITFKHLAWFTWNRVVTMVRLRHRWNWGQVRRWLTDPNGRWHPPHAGDVFLLDAGKVTVTRYRYRGTKIRPFWVPAT